MQNNRHVGNKGEATASNYLKDLGYEFVESNFETPYGEIDLIMLKGSDLYFFEVKFRQNNEFGFGDDAINPKKIMRIRKSIEVWISLNQHKYSYKNIYLDGIVIDSDGKINRYEIL